MREALLRPKFYKDAHIVGEYCIQVRGKLDISEISIKAHRLQCCNAVEAKAQHLSSPFIEQSTDSAATSLHLGTMHRSAGGVVMGLFCFLKLYVRITPLTW